MHESLSGELAGHQGGRCGVRVRMVIVAVIVSVYAPGATDFLKGMFPKTARYRVLTDWFHSLYPCRACYPQFAIND